MSRLPVDPEADRAAERLRDLAERDAHLAPDLSDPRVAASMALFERRAEDLDRQLARADAAARQFEVDRAALDAMLAEQRAPEVVFVPVYVLVPVAVDPDDAPGAASVH